MQLIFLEYIYKYSYMHVITIDEKEVHILEIEQEEV